MPSDFLPADWPAPANIRALTTLRTGPGRSELRELLALPSEPSWLHQVHGTTVAVEPGTDEPEADAATTSQSGTVLAIVTADCLPVLICNDDGSEIAAAHAGWRGLAAGVLEATVRAMVSSPDRLLAWLGPAAGAKAYEVGAEVREALIDGDAAADSHFAATRPGHWLVDLPALARRRLATVGVSRVFGGGECTISHPDRWYSYRRDGRTGRMASLIWRVDPRPSPPAVEHQGAET